jgi:hypothetical protein
MGDSVIKRIVSVQIVAGYKLIQLVMKGIVSVQIVAGYKLIQL